MGRNNTKYKKSLQDQAYERLKSMLAPGESKHFDKHNNPDNCKDKIYSFSTYKAYKKHIGYFVQWIRKTHPDVKTLRKARRYVPDFLKIRSETKNKSGQYLSAWTISLEAAALSKLYGIDKSDPDRFQPPPRHRVDIVRSRGDVERDKHFSTKNNSELIKFCRATGCRRNVLEKLRGDDYWTRDRMEERVFELEDKSKTGGLDSKEKTMLRNLKGSLQMFPEEKDFVYHRKDKGGKSRFAPVIGPDRNMVIERFLRTESDKKVWLHVHTKADIHSYRADYVTMIYHKYAREISDIPYDRINKGSGKRYQSDVYHTRGDCHMKLDKRAMAKASYAVGHARISVIASSYLYNV